MGFVLVLGGARSGKSDLALRLGVESARPVTFIATATPDDSEMAARIARHLATRPARWTTLEEPLELCAAVSTSAAADFVIVDCLTLWVSNLLASGQAPEEIAALALEAAGAMARRDGAVVTNEVGLGVVPANELGRTFRDGLGRVNQIFAERSQRALLMVAGRALELKAT